MKVVVCVESWELSEASRAALALAAGLGPDAEVIALSATDASAAEALAEAQRLGAARVAQVMEMALEGLEVTALGKTLAAAVRELGGELVLCGARSDGEGRGVVPAAVAHHLGVPYLPHVEAVAVAGQELEVVLRSGGRKRKLAVPVPALLTVGAAVSAPAGAPAAAREVEVIKLADAGNRTVGRASDLGTLERPKRKPAAVSSAGDLLRRWLESE
jgi:electron transfer flavoprotein alpha/beta subunit